MRAGGDELLLQPPHPPAIDEPARHCATELEVTDEELRLTVDAGPSALDEGQVSEETTAWGLFVVPLHPESVRVGYEERPENGGDAEWMTITVLGPDAPRSGPGPPT